MQQNIEFSIYLPDLFPITCISLPIYLSLHIFLHCISIYIYFSLLFSLCLSPAFSFFLSFLVDCNRISYIQHASLLHFVRVELNKLKDKAARRTNIQTHSATEVLLQHYKNIEYSSLTYCRRRSKAKKRATQRANRQTHSTTEVLLQHYTEH